MEPKWGGPQDVKASFSMHLFHIPTLISTEFGTKRESLPWQSFLQGLEDHLCISFMYVHMINKLKKGFKVATIERDATLEDALKPNIKLLNLQTKLCQAQM